MSHIKFQNILKMNQKKLIAFLKEKNIVCDTHSKKIIYNNIIEYLSINKPDTIYEGVLELINNYGFLRNKNSNFLNNNYDIFIPPYVMRKNHLREGDLVQCTIKVKSKEQKCFMLREVISINGEEKYKIYNNFSDLKATYPIRQIILENKDEATVTGRMIDLICPIGFGQRGLIVAQPKAGKTTILHHIAKSIMKNYSESKLIILLIGERPEEVNEMEEIIKDNKNVELFYSTFDNDCSKQIKTSEMTLKYAKRLVEQEKDVIILMDSLTRLVRAYNITVPSSGRVWSGGMEPAAIQRAKKFFGAARASLKGSSLTIISTCLTQTGSRMDDLIFEEFKGTGNLEITLNRDLANQNIYPAISINESGTRRAEKMLKNMQKIKVLNNYLSHSSNDDPQLQGKKLISLINKSENNEELLQKIMQEGIKYTQNQSLLFKKRSNRLNYSFNNKKLK